MSEIFLGFLDDREEYTLPGFPRQISSPISIPSPTAQRRTPQASLSSSSTASISYSGDLCRVSHSSTTNSTGPSLFRPSAINPINYGYDLVCEFEFVGCSLSFHPAQIYSWISHNASHFCGHHPPSKTCCTFCDRVSESIDNPVSSWKQRMRHMADHFRNFERREDIRPDFFVIEYMQKKCLLSAEDYKYAIRRTERPSYDGLVGLGFKSSEFNRKEEMEQSLSQPIFSPMKQDLIERIMKGFWGIFNKESETIQ